jgi:hypothetical protein
MSLFVREFECPSCGGRIRRENPAAKSLGCPYCGQTSHLYDDKLDAKGQQHLLIDYGSMLHVGLTASLNGRRFRVLGRLRIAYEDGFWDEWYVYFLDTNTEGWIQEDDGEFVAFEPIEELDKISYHDTKVGNFMRFNSMYHTVFITSKSKAQVEGGEGELPFRIIPGEPADFIEGIQDGKVVSIEILPEETHLYVGAPFKLDELAL